MDASAALDRLRGALTERRTGEVVRTACELMAAFWFQQKYPVGFRYEVESRPGKQLEGPLRDFDFAFRVDRSDFNVEVKCFDRDSEQDVAPFKVFNLRVRQEFDATGVEYSRNRNQTLLQFLKKANCQLVRPASGMSVVLLCCKDWDVMADVLECLVGQNGILNARHAESTLLNETPGAAQVKRADLANIDAVVICDAGMYHEAAVRRTRFAKTSPIDVALNSGKQPWQYESSVPFGFFINAADIPAKLQEEFSQVFNSHTGWLGQLLKDGYSLQDAMFAVCNSKRLEKLRDAVAECERDLASAKRESER